MMLTDQEIELVNMLRGFTAEGEALASPWHLAVDYQAGHWRVCSHGVDGGEAYTMESGLEESFDAAWVMQCDPRLRAEAEADKAAVIRRIPPPSRPRLRLIKGGADD